MSQTIIEVPLDHIVPSPTNPRKYFNEKKLQELAESIKLVDVIQPVTLRDLHNRSGKYEMVCGERRLRASRLVGKGTVPSIVKNLTDTEVQEIQFIENIEREDVHPMDEAVTYKAMLANKTKPWTVEDIAAKINKPVSYIVQRLQLNKLIGELQKHFWDEHFLIGHALLFARLTEADQKECLKNTNIRQGNNYKSVKEVSDYIDRNVMRKLSASPFKKDDGLLLPSAGPCTTCSKCSSWNTTLFAEYNGKDENARCFDKVCFEKKKAAWLVLEVKKVLETHPDILLVDYGYSGVKVPGDIAKLAAKYKVHILDYSNSEIQTYNNTGYTAFKALYVSGPEAGQYKTVYRKLASKEKAAAKATTGEKVTAAEIDEQITGIKQRLQRGTELDYEKVQDLVVKEIRAVCPHENVLKNALPEDLRDLIIAFFLYNKASGDFHKKIGLKEKSKEDYDDTPNLLFARLKQLSLEQYDSLLLDLIMDKYQGYKIKGVVPELLRKLAKAIGVDVDGLVKGQEEAKTKREANAAKRIADLQAQKKALAKPAAKKNGIKKLTKGLTVAPAAKKIARAAKKVAKKARTKVSSLMQDSND